MTFIVSQNVVNLYLEPNTSSPLLSQAMLGERVSVLEERGDFRRVSTEDTYSGWLEARCLTPQSDLSDLLSTTIATLFADVYTYPDAHSEITTKLTVGTRVTASRRSEAFWSVLARQLGVGAAAVALA